MRILYTLTLFLSSALLFLVQPMVAKIILPAFGGSPAVWTASMVFFQAVLLAGYAYAHYSTKKLGPRRQAMLHVPLMALALLTLPFVTHIHGGAEGSRTPLLGVLGALFSMVGAVFFVVSAGSPVLQRWFAVTDDPAAKDPYFLYSASNVGSMLALLAYPILVEPRLKLSEQTVMWTDCYAVLVLLMAGAAAVGFFKKGKSATAEESDTIPSEPITNRQRASWIILGAIPSSLLLGVTAYLTSNIAPIPLLWVIPLALYLLTFIFAFAPKPKVKSVHLARVLPLLLTPLSVAIILESTSPILPLAVFHLAVFFVAAWMCHSRLSESRPDPAHLTEFYLCLSIGGVVGGLFNAVLAPVLFATLLEYPIALVAVCFARLPAKPENDGFNRIDALYPTVLGLLTIAITVIVKLSNMPPDRMRTLVAIGLPTALCFFAVDRPRRYALSLGALFAAAFAMHTSSAGLILYTARSFFGVHRVVQSRSHGHVFRTLVHGTTRHGEQDMDDPTVPLTYYTRSGPIGDVFQYFHGPAMKRNVALVGLGVGSLAAYGEPGQSMTFFEIDPVVKSIATNPAYFTYVRDSKAKVDIVLGDARLTLSEQPDGKFGLIVLDAFSSDAIPVHLLTKEAIQLYLRKLEPHGVLALHISNNYIDLAPVLANIAGDLGLVSYLNDDKALTDEEKASGKEPSTWVLLASNTGDLGKIVKGVVWEKKEASPNAKIWTDDYSNILGSFRWSDQTK